MEDLKNVPFCSSKTIALEEMGDVIGEMAILMYEEPLHDSPAVRKCTINMSTWDWSEGKSGTEWGVLMVGVAGRVTDEEMPG